MKLIPLLTVAVIFITGCTTPPVSYYYGSYSRTLYRSKKDNTPESIAKHRQTLEDIIQTSEKRSLKVPPGIYCEYAYLLTKEGIADADRYFSKEVSTYPESERFVSFVRAQFKQQSQ